MNPRVPSAANLRLRSETRGRVRWEVDGLFRNAMIASRVQADMSGEDGIVRVNANPLTGRILVLFNPETVDAQRTGEMIVSVLRLIYDETIYLENGEPEDQLSWHSGRLRDNELLSLVRELELNPGMRRRAVRLSIANTLVKLMSHLTFGFIIAIAIVGGFAPLARLGLTSVISQIGGTSAVYFILRGVEEWLDKNKKVAWRVYANRVEQGLRLRTFEQTMGLDMVHLENQSTDRIIRLINSDAGKIKKCIDHTPPNVIEKALILLLGSGLILVISPIAFMLTYSPIPFVIAVNRYYKKSIEDNFKQSSRYHDRFNRILLNNLQGFATIKGFTSEDKEITRLRESSEDLYGAERDMAEKNARMNSLINYAVGFGVISPLIYGCFAMALGTLSFVYFMLMSAILPVVLTATTGLDDALTYYREGVEAARRIARHLARQARIIDGNTRLAIADVRGALRFENVSFGYNTHHVLDGVDLDIPATATVAFVGPTGMGKTTVTKLLLRFYDVTGGRITIDSHDLRDLNLRDLRTAIGLASQDVYLFNGTIYENILYGCSGAGYEEVVQASRDAEAFEFIRRLPQGFDTMVGERGQKLSGGQRQRISIARTILKNPPVFILDEATSSVDNKTEAYIQRSLKRISRDRTTIIIAHRLSTVRHADCIFLLKDAAVPEKGTHEELIKMGGEYAYLWQLETEENGKPGDAV